MRKLKDLYCIATTYRTAIMEAKRNREFDRRDRMSNFPGGCCDDSCDLLAHYIYDEYGIDTMQRNGIYHDRIPNNITNHAWLVTYDNTIIDITADQFEFFSGYAEGVYVGKENSFYKHLERQQFYENVDIMTNSRLLRDYQIIVNYIKNPPCF